MRNLFAFGVCLFFGFSNWFRHEINFQTFTTTTTTTKAIKVFYRCVCMVMFLLIPKLYVQSSIVSTEIIDLMAMLERSSYIFGIVRSRTNRLVTKLSNCNMFKIKLTVFTTEIFSLRTNKQFSTWKVPIFIIQNYFPYIIMRENDETQ